MKVSAVRSCGGLFIYPFPWRQTCLAGHSTTSKVKTNKKQNSTKGQKEGKWPRKPSCPSSSGLHRGPYSLHGTLRCRLVLLFHLHLALPYCLRGSRRPVVRCWGHCRAPHSAWWWRPLPKFLASQPIAAPAPTLISRALGHLICLLGMGREGSDWSVTSSS